MKKFAVSLLLSLIGITANAQSSFSGFSLYGNLNHLTTSTKITSAPDTFDGLGKSAIGFTLGGDYGLSIGGSNVLLIGATYNLGGPEYLDFNDITNGNSFKFKEKQGWSVYVAPGTEVVKDILLYAKLGYHFAKIEATGDIVGDQEFKGFGYGVGSRINLNKTTFLTVEFQQINYGEETALSANWKPSVTVGSIGLGFTF